MHRRRRLGQRQEVRRGRPLRRQAHFVRQPWADYIAKFIKAYGSEGIPVWGITVQNEPLAKQRWESCIFSVEDERDFVKNFLGPTLKREGLGGPNHSGNFCFAPVHADMRTGELTYTSSYYYIGHFPKFVRPGARRIAAAPSRSTLLSTAFINPDGRLATIVMNAGDAAVTCLLCIAGYAAEVNCPAHSIQTLVVGIFRKVSD